MKQCETRYRREKIKECAHTCIAGRLDTVGAVVAVQKLRRDGYAMTEFAKRGAMRHTSLAAAIVVTPQLGGVDVGCVFFGSALLGVLPLQLHERPVPLRLDDIAFPLDL